MKRILITSLFSILTFSIAACGEKPTQTNEAKGANMGTEVSEKSSQSIELQNARIRLPPNGMTMTAGYADIKNNSNNPVTIIGATSEISPRIELHVHEKSADGMMAMKKVDEFTIGANETFSLAPGGAHLMIFDLNKELTAGESVKLNLKFKGLPDVSVSTIIVEDPTMPQNGSKQSH